MHKDRADAVVTTILAILSRRLRDPVLHAEIVASPQDEFVDLRREIVGETYTPPSE